MKLRLTMVAFALLLGGMITSAEEVVRPFEIHFHWDKTHWDPDYLGNAETIKSLAAVIDSIGVDRIVSLNVKSQSSPEGVYEHNLWLSDHRAKEMRAIIARYLPHELLYKTTIDPDGESWARLRDYVSKDSKLTEKSKQKVLDVIDSDINIGTKKWRMSNALGTDPNVGDVYKYLYRVYYPVIRNSVIITIYVAPDPEPEPIPEPEPEPQPEPQPEPEPEPEPEPVPEPEIRAKETIFALKTNLLYDAITALNFEIEVPIGHRWSIMYEDIFPWWEYSKNKYAFQNWEMGLEGRFWFKPWGWNTNKLLGHFVGVYGMSGRGDLQIDYKPDYQVHYWSAGATYGFALPLGRKHWGNLEFSLSVGYLNSDYQHYYPTEIYDKLMRDPYDAGRVSYFGPTKAKVSLVIPFNFYTKRATEEAKQLKEAANN